MRRLCERGEARYISAWHPWPRRPRPLQPPLREPTDDPGRVARGRLPLCAQL